MILQDLIALDGKLELHAQDGRFLGLLSSQRNDPNSIVNLNTYGNANYINSIHYEHGVYGGEYGRHSPYNRNCQCPPMIKFQQQCLGLVTKNKSIIDRDLEIVDPDLMITLYMSLSDRANAQLASD